MPWFMTAKSPRRPGRTRRPRLRSPRPVKAAPPRKNRRRHVRAGVPSTVILFFGHRPIGPCVVEDVSEGGLRVVTDRKLPRGRIVSVLSDLPGGGAAGPLVAFAQVARCQARRRSEFVLGLAFVDLPREEAQRLNEIVARVLADSQPGVDFFDTDDARAKRLVLAEDAPLLLQGTKRPR
jgi:hypothetical protein